MRAPRRKAAKEFESVFISQFLGSMFSGIPTDGPFGGGQGEEMFRSLMIDEYGKAIEAARRLRPCRRGDAPAAEAPGSAAAGRERAMSETKLQDAPRIERLIALAERLIVALEADIAALKAGKPGDMQSLDPEIQKLSVLYGREAQNFDIRIAKAAPPSLRAALPGHHRQIPRSAAAACPHADAGEECRKA